MALFKTVKSPHLGHTSCSTYFGTLTPQPPYKKGERSFASSKYRPDSKPSARLFRSLAVKYKGKTGSRRRRDTAQKLNRKRLLPFESRVREGR